MLKRGRPPVNRAPQDKITAKGITVGQQEFLNKGWQRRGFESAAHYLRYIIDAYIDRVRSHQEEDRFTPKGVEQLDRSQRKTTRRKK